MFVLLVLQANSQLLTQKDVLNALGVLTAMLKLELVILVLKGQDLTATITAVVLVLQVPTLWEELLSLVKTVVSALTVNLAVENVTLARLVLASITEIVLLASTTPTLQVAVINYPARHVQAVRHVTPQLEDARPVLQVQDSTVMITLVRPVPVECTLKEEQLNVLHVTDAKIVTSKLEAVRPAQLAQGSVTDNVPPAQITLTLKEVTENASNALDVLIVTPAQVPAQLVPPAFF